MSKKTKKIVVVVLVLLICFFLYRSFSGKKSTDAPSAKNGLSTAGGTATVTVEKNDDIEKLLSLLLSINSIKLSDTLFSKVEFKSLKDFSITEKEQKLDETTGRKNPFLPIGIEIGGSTTSSTSQSSTTGGNSTATTTNTTTNTTASTGVTTGTANGTGNATNPGVNVVPVANPAPLPNTL